MEECASVGIAKTGGGPVMSVVPLRLSDHRGKSAVYRVAVTVTHLHSGSMRPWFSCPRCRRRAGRLYAPAVEVLGCRVCLKLVYRCQYRKQTMWARLLRNFCSWGAECAANRWLIAGRHFHN